MSRRGPDPSDARMFRSALVPTLASACADLSWLLARGYAEKAALKLVGDRFQLAGRQRHAVVRATCTPAQQQGRAANHVALAGQPVAVDGFNTLLLLERALGGGPLFLGLDGVLRDIGGVHGTYRTVDHTLQAVELLRDGLEAAGAGPVELLLDRPVSNSGRLAALVREAIPGWTVEVRDHVDADLIASEAVVCSADAGILDRCARWNAVVPALVEERIPEAWVVDLRGQGTSPVP